MFENLKFGKTGFKTYVLEKHFISYSCILFLIFNALRSVFKNQVVFSKILVFQIFDWSNLFFDQSKILLKFFMNFCLFQSIETDFRSIENHKWAFFKSQILTISKHLFQKFFHTFLSLSDLARLHSIFCHFPPKFLQGFSLLSRYVYFTLPFALFFSFSCIISWFLGRFSNYA